MEWSHIRICHVNEKFTIRIFPSSINCINYKFKECILKLTDLFFSPHYRKNVFSFPIPLINEIDYSTCTDCHSYKFVWPKEESNDQSLYLNHYLTMPVLLLLTTMNKGLTLGRSLNILSTFMNIIPTHRDFLDPPATGTSGRGNEVSHSSIWRDKYEPGGKRGRRGIDKW